MTDIELPEGWIATSMEEVCLKIQDGTHFSPKEQSQAGNFKYVTAKNIKQWGIDTSNVTYVSESVHRVIFQRCSPEKGDVLYIKDGATTGIATINDLDEEFSLLSSVALLKPNRACIDPLYLKWYLNSPVGFKYMTDQMTGSAITRLTLVLIRNSTIPIPPLVEQSRIVAKVETLLARANAARQRLAKVPALLKRFRQSVLAAACSGQLTEDWRDAAEPEWSQGRLGDVGTVSGGITKNQQRDAMATQVPYLRVANVYANRLELSEIMQIGVTDGEFARTELRDGDLLFVEGNGSLDQIGRVAMWDGSIPRCVHQNHLIKFRAGANVVARYALISMMSPSGREQLIEKAISSAGLHSLSISKIADVKLEMPPLPEQHEIVRRAEALLARADRIEKRLATATRRVETLTQAILAQAFRGELVPTEAELARREGRDYEPAAALLERIRAERQGQQEPKAPRKRKTPTK